MEGLPLGRMVQFNGKWPFHRLGGMQEPLSVVFSLANLWAHWRGWRDLSARGGGGGGAEGLRWAYRVYALSGINTWVWSAVFHTRDVGWTEKADYFSAAGTMLCGLWIAGIRLGGLYGGAGGHRTSRSTLARTWTTLCLVIFLLHCLYLSHTPRFNYTYNMQFNILIALLQILLWSTWSIRHLFLLPAPSPSLYASPTPTRAPHAHLPLLPLILLPALTALELLDFGPLGLGAWRLLDAHALWHASTVVVVRMWYGFLGRDLKWVQGGLNGGGRVGMEEGEEGARGGRRLE